MILLLLYKDIVNAFKDRDGDPNSLSCAPKIVQKKESNFIKGPVVDERFQDQNVPSTCTIADQIHDSGKAGTNDNEKEDQSKLYKN